jgi:hypothetical protein
VYENRGNKLHGCYKVVRFRGYYEELEWKNHIIHRI